MMDFHALRAAALEHARNGVLGPAVHVGGCRLCGCTVTWMTVRGIGIPAAFIAHACEAGRWGTRERLAEHGEAGPVGLVDHLGWLALTPEEMEECRVAAQEARR